MFCMKKFKYFLYVTLVLFIKNEKIKNESANPLNI